MPYVILTFKPECRESWKEATKSAASNEPPDNFISIYLDDDLLISSFVATEYADTGIDSDSCIITFGGDRDEMQKALDLANTLNGGHLPLVLTLVSTEKR